MVRTSNGYTQCPGSDPGRGKAENEELGMLGSLKITLKIFFISAGAYTLPDKSAKRCTFLLLFLHRFFY